MTTYNLIRPFHRKGLLIKNKLFATCCFLAIALLGSCVTPQQKKDMDEDILRLQTRVLQLETTLATNHEVEQKLGEAHHKTLASTSSDVERLGIEIKRMHGDIDALKVGVQTGQMPGQEVGADTTQAGTGTGTAGAGSVASQLNEIRARLDAIEAQQKDLIAGMAQGAAQSSKKAPPKKAAVAPASDDDSAPDLESLGVAFGRKHYKEVAEDAPRVLKSAKGKEKEQVLMIYGESLMRLNRPKEAALQFNDLVEMKPNDHQIAVAKLRLGDAFKAMGDKETSRLFYEEVSSKYSGTPEGEKAKKALKSKKLAKSKSDS